MTTNDFHRLLTGLILGAILAVLSVVAAPQIPEGVDMEKVRERAEELAIKEVGR